MVKGRISIQIIGIVVIALLLQVNRGNGFLHLFKNTNQSISLGELKNFPQGRPLLQEKFLIIFDRNEAQSVELKDNIEKTLDYAKKPFQSVTMAEAKQMDPSYDCVVVATGNLLSIPAMTSCADYVRAGGSVFLATCPWPSVGLTQLSPYLGIDSYKDEILENVPGIKFYSDLLIGAKGKVLLENYIANSCVEAKLNPKATLHMTTGNDIPLAWETAYGQGRFIVCNGTFLEEKAQRGLIVGLLSRSREVFAYPILGIKIVNIDDFPAPFPGGYEENIFKEYELNIQDFYKQIWWPDMLKTAERYGLKYTGLFIETYNNRVKPPFEPENKGDAAQNLTLYGRELLKSGGEIGLHGYNHQSLAPFNWIKTDLGYNHWPSRQDMTLAVEETVRYFGEVFQQYKIRSYVPPSNILSPDGREALKQALPDLSIIASLYIGDQLDSYSQEFEQNTDGILEIPRITYGFLEDPFNDWCTWNTLSALGVFSHFVHPDDVLDTQRGAGLSWKELYKQYDHLFAKLDADYPWLVGCTLSEAGEHLKDFLAIKYSLQQSQDRIMLYSGDYRGQAVFIVKSDQKLKAGKNCQVKLLDGSSYLVTVTENEAELVLESGEGK